MIQFVNPDSILNLKHLLFAIKQSFYAKNNQLLASRDFEVDLLMRISITDQIQEALKFSGITPNNQSYILIAVGNKSNLKLIEKWIIENHDYSSDIVIDNYKNLSKIHKIDFNKLNKLNIELDLLSYSAVKLTLKFSDSS